MGRTGTCRRGHGLGSTHTWSPTTHVDSGSGNPSDRHRTVAPETPDRVRPVLPTSPFKHFTLTCCPVDVLTVPSLRLFHHYGPRPRRGTCLGSRTDVSGVSSRVSSVFPVGLGPLTGICTPGSSLEDYRREPHLSRSTRETPPRSSRRHFRGVGRSQVSVTFFLVVVRSRTGSRYRGLDRTLLSWSRNLA